MAIGKHDPTACWQEKIQVCFKYNIKNEECLLSRLMKSVGEQKSNALQKARQDRIVYPKSGKSMQF
jgi:hypothetical protein